MGAGPTPLACTRSPQKGWSPKKGTMVVGHYLAKTTWITISRSQYMESKVTLNTASYEAITAALRPAAVVPAPP